MVAIIPARTLDKEINKQLELLSNLHAQKNSFLPIFRLPPETLAHIFTHGARDYYNEDKYHPTSRVPDWVNVSYVCRHWREVALNCSTLWSYPFVISLRWTEELLARSRQALLKIRICLNPLEPTSWCSPLVEKLLDHIDRTQELYLHVPTTVFPSRLSLRAPHLQVLDIDSTLSPPSDLSSMPNGIEILPLRILKLANCSLPWYSFNLSCVTTLFLCGIPAPKQNIMEFLATVTRMQALTVLHIDDAFACPRNFLSDGAFDIASKIDLPPLAHLSVGAPLSTVVAFLSCANISLQTQVRLEFQPESRFSVDDFAEIPSVVAQRFNQSSSPKIRSSIIRFPLSYEFAFTFSLSERGDCVPDISMVYPPQDPHVSFTALVGFDYSMAASDRNHVMDDICSSIPLAHVQSLHIARPPLPLGFWRKTLHHTHELRRLKLSDGYMPNLTSFLALSAGEPVRAPVGGTSNRDATGHTCVPALEELMLHRIMFARDEHSEGDIVSEKRLRDTLSTRGTLCSRINMFECNVAGDTSDLEDDGVYVSESSDEY